jgi:cell division inhibitor SepF
MAGLLAKGKEFLGWPTSEPEEGSWDGVDEYGVESRVDLRAAAPVRAPRSTETHSLTNLRPRSFNDAKEIGEAYRSGVTTIINVSDLSQAEAKRIVDFSSGLIFALNGSIERIDEKVFLLSPADVEILSDSQTAVGGGTEFLNHS